MMASGYIYLFLGTAVGGGVVIGGDYHRGAHGNAGDLGLMPTSPSRLATAPIPGRGEILLTRASISALRRHLRGANAAMATREQFDAAIAAWPALVDEWLDDAADALVGPFLSATCVLDVEAIVLDGDLPRPVLEGLLRRLRRLLPAAAPDESKSPPIGLGRVGRHAAAIGAAILPLHVHYSPCRATPTNGADRTVNSRVTVDRLPRLRSLAPHFGQREA